MPVITKTTRVFGDATRAAKDLCSNLPAGDDAVGFLVCDAQLDGAAVVEKVAAAATFPVVGCTTIAFPLQGEAPPAARLVIYKKAGLQAAVAVSAPLQAAEAEAQMQALVRDCVDKMEEAPRLFLMFAPPMPGVVCEKIAHNLLAAAGNVPVFGGMATAEAEVLAAEAAVFAEGRAYANQVVLLALGGPVKPIFAAEASLTTFGDVYEVEESRVEEVFAAGGQTMDEILAPFEIPSPGVPILHYGAEALMENGILPVQVFGRQPAGDTVPDIHGIIHLNENSAIFTSAMPPGSRFQLGSLQQSDIVGSAEQCIDNLLNRMAVSHAEGYDYTLLFSVPCVVRHYAQVGGYDLESGTLNKRIPRQLGHVVFYGNGEVAPVHLAGGGWHNRTLEASLVMCAI